MPEIIFKPDDKSVNAQPGTTLLDAAREAGVRIRNDCSGKGVCGRCLVEILSGQVHGDDGRFGLKDSQKLACRTIVLESDVTVSLPELSRDVEDNVTVAQADVRTDDRLSKNALIHSVKLNLDQPSLDDNVCDFDRISRALAEHDPDRYGTDTIITANAGVMRHLPEKVRDSDWQPELIIAATDAGKEVLEIRSGGEPPIMLAVDIGTTAIKAELLTSGRRRFTASCYNSQVAYGPDIISRIVYCEKHKGGIARLQGAVIGDINRLLNALIEKYNIDKNDIWGCAVAGNTTMMHLFAGISPFWIRREPYTGACYTLPVMQAQEVGLDIHHNGRVFALPAISGFVGADLTAGALDTRIDVKEDVVMLVDMGTNGEIVLGSKEFIVCCSASAGPAFEGEAGDSGTRAMPGAIESVWWDNGLKWKTIDDKPAIGMCGSGYIDLLAVMLQQGIVNKSGHLARNSDYVTVNASDESGCIVARYGYADVAREIVVTQADIDNLIRAKAAIYAAAQILLQSMGLQWDHLAKIMLAGSFGEKVNKDNAVNIGLLPDVDRDKIEFVGNTSLNGVIKAAGDIRQFELARRLAKNTTYFELSTHPDYMEQFMAAKFLPHTRAEEFASTQNEENVN